MFRKWLITAAFISISSLFLISCSQDPAGPDDSQTNHWPVSTPELQGIDSEMLAAAFEEGQNAQFVDGILIIKNGYLVAETYYNGYDANRAHNVKSVSKSFLSALTGIALREGYLENLNQKMLDFFPEYQQYVTDIKKEEITIRHLLMMRAGIDDERNNYSHLYSSPDWIKATLEFPFLYDPGSIFAYNTFQTHLLSAIITKTSGMSTLAFGQKFLFGPLNINIDQWQQDPQGYYFGGNNM